MQFLAYEPMKGEIALLSTDDVLTGHDVVAEGDVVVIRGDESATLYHVMSWLPSDVDIFLDGLRKLFEASGDSSRLEAFLSSLVAQCGKAGRASAAYEIGGAGT
jgi:hypothetical protein